MASIKAERRVYALPLPQLFGLCLTAIGILHATIERHDVEQGTIIALVGAGLLGPITELSLALRPLDEGRTELVATWRARKRGGDRRLLAVFLDAVDGLIE
ncbi:MAG: hypothetical protein ABIV47_26265 [Roseiflexaceae bacterium]